MRLCSKTPSIIQDTLDSNSLGGTVGCVRKEGEKKEYVWNNRFRIKYGEGSGEEVCLHSTNKTKSVNVEKRSF
jgi:hypothetical protein